MERYLADASGGTLHWESKAYECNTGANSWITAWTSGLHWTWAYEGVLEVYGANSCSQLPSSGYAYFFDNYVDHGYSYYDYVSPAFWGAVYQTGGLPCYFSTYANNTTTTRSCTTKVQDCLQFERTVNRDNTVRLQNLTFEAVKWPGKLAGCSVTPHQHLEEL